MGQAHAFCRGDVQFRTAFVRGAKTQHLTEDPGHVEQRLAYSAAKQQQRKGNHAAQKGRQQKDPTTVARAGDGARRGKQLDIPRPAGPTQIQRKIEQEANAHSGRRARQPGQTRPNRIPEETGQNSRQHQPVGNAPPAKVKRGGHRHQEGQQDLSGGIESRLRELHPEDQARAARAALTAAPTMEISSLVSTTSKTLPCSGDMVTISCRYWLSRGMRTNRALGPVRKNLPGPSIWMLLAVAAASARCQRTSNSQQR